MFGLLQSHAPEGESEAQRNAELDAALQKIGKGDREAVSDVYARTASAVYGFILSIVRNTEDAEDLLQDTYVKLCLNADQYQSQGKPMAWILTIARNLSLMKLRGRRRMADLPEYEWEALEDSDSEFHTEDRMVLDAALRVLSGEESNIVMLHAVAGLKHREIAEMLDMPLATVLSKYNRALKKMKKVIGER
ncbi:MAG: RNA polymerase sigma factor [Lachnospiraceae bacterium]|nr:RNA polymerase sigma factor [Lachnospiraceae bacterium]